jgi:hypothetical protein
MELNDVFEGEQLEDETLVLGGKPHRSAGRLRLRLAHSRRHRYGGLPGIALGAKRLV